MYVQDRLREAGDEVWRLLDAQGAHFYVCGDASSMAGAVEQELLALFAARLRCVRASVHACVCMRACVRACKCACSVSSEHGRQVQVAHCRKRASAAARTRASMCTVKPHQMAALVAGPPLPPPRCCSLHAGLRGAACPALTLAAWPASSWEQCLPQGAVEAAGMEVCFLLFAGTCSVFYHWARHWCQCASG